MTLYHFALTLGGVTADTTGLEDALYAAGCDDALICFYGKAVYLEFDRESENFAHAICSAISDIESANIGAKVISVDSSLVGLSDIAELTELSRQAIAMLKDGTRGPGGFPSLFNGSAAPHRYGAGLTWRPGWHSRGKSTHVLQTMRSVWNISISLCNCEAIGNASRLSTTAPCWNTRKNRLDGSLQPQDLFNERDGQLALGGDRGAIELIEGHKQRAHLAIQPFQQEAAHVFR